MMLSRNSLVSMHMPNANHAQDPDLSDVVTAIQTADPDGVRSARVFRETFDQLYDGEHTGRYSVDQLYKTEKTHFGTLIEINLRREFREIISDGETLDFSIAGHDIDCKFSFTDGGWMLPPECFGLLLLVTTADDAKATWSMGVVRATEGNRRSSTNRDAKTSLNRNGRNAIHWLHRDAQMAPNVLLSLDEETRARIFEPGTGQARINELFRRVTNQRIGRNVVATVAQQKDYMKRARYDGGARSVLQPEGYLILGGYASHRGIASSLGIVVPGPGEFVSVRVVPCEEGGASVLLDGQWWRCARSDETILEQAPRLPKTTRVRPSGEGSD